MSPDLGQLGDSLVRIAAALERIADIAEAWRPKPPSPPGSLPKLPQTAFNMENDRGR